jgi:hypothetical protein
MSGQTAVEWGEHYFWDVANMEAPHGPLVV